MITFLSCFNATPFPWVFAALVSLSPAVMLQAHHHVFSGTAGSCYLTLLISWADTFGVAVALKMVSHKILHPCFAASICFDIPVVWDWSHWNAFPRYEARARGLLRTVPVPAAQHPPHCPELTYTNLPWDRMTVFLYRPQPRLSKLFLKTTTDKDPLCSRFQCLTKKFLPLPCCDLLRWLLQCPLRTQKFTVLCVTTHGLLQYCCDLSCLVPTVFFFRRCKSSPSNLFHEIIIFCSLLIFIAIFCTSLTYVCIS